MKKIFFIFLLTLLTFNLVNADINYDTDYTLIDCVNWNNNTAVSFDNEKPYSTLKSWIEGTINFINSNINKSWNEETASWKVFMIKVNCSFDDIFNPSIYLNYNWVAYNNELIIEWIWEGSLTFKEVDFKLWHKSWNITFKNAIFKNENKPYFYDLMVKPWQHWKPRTHPISNWIKIIDSYILLKNWNNLWYKNAYHSYYYKYYNRYYYDNLVSYSNKQIIINSIIDIEIDNNFTFTLPVIIKDSKINIKSWTWVYDVKFNESCNWWTDINFAVLTSNEINLWWNNFIWEDTQKLSFLNNNFINISDFNFWEQTVFINNFIDNNESINISTFFNLFNNIFKSGFTSSYDIMNNRRNFSENNVSWWLWWIYKRIRSNKFFNIDINSSSLYKEVTWKDLPFWLWEIYIIFNY